MDSNAYMSREEYERLEDARSALKRLEELELELEWKATPLWRLFREALCEGGECRDIVEKHVLPKLNQTDVKFFYDVNTETRALIKRAAPSGITLEKRFKVSEMSSISTLEFVWENRSLWPIEWNETEFAYLVAYTNKLELLKWALGVKKCEWDSWTLGAAADVGNLEMLKYCVADQYFMELCMDYFPCARAAENGHLECLKYLHEVAKAPWEYGTAYEAALNGHLHILEYLVERKFDNYGNYACASAARGGHLDCLKYLHEVAKAPWDWKTAAEAAKYGHFHILKYLVERKYDKYEVRTCSFAAWNGHLDGLKYLHEVVKAPWDYGTADAAAENGHLHILEYLVEREFDKFEESACWRAAKRGHLDCLKYLHEVAKAPWDSRAVEFARERDRRECLHYLLDNGCPLPYGWRYENGELFRISIFRKSRIRFRI